MLSHSVSSVSEVIPLTRGPQSGPSSLVPVEEGEVEDLDLPSTPKTFEAARDLIALMGPHSPNQCEKSSIPKPPAPQRPPVPSWGKPLMMRPCLPSARQRQALCHHGLRTLDSSALEMEFYVSRRSQH